MFLKPEPLPERAELSRKKDGTFHLKVSYDHDMVDVDDLGFGLDYYFVHIISDCDET